MKNATLIVVGVAALAAVVILMKRKAQVRTANLSTGLIGAQSHSPDIATGGAIAALGSVLGGTVSSWFGGGASSPGQVGVDTNTPPTSSTTLWNPVTASPAVLPYSYKQQVIDQNAGLGTTTLFTPDSAGSGSSGSYLESTPGGTTTNFDYGFGP